MESLKFSIKYYIRQSKSRIAIIIIACRVDAATTAEREETFKLG